MNRTTAVIAAGGMTILVVFTLLGIAGANWITNTVDEAAVEDEAVLDQPTEPETDPYIEQLEERKDALEDTVTVMEDRQAEYQTELSEAEAIIADMEAQIEALEASLEEDQVTINNLSGEVVAVNGTVGNLRAVDGEVSAKEQNYINQIEAANANIVALQDYIKQLAGQ